MELGISIFDGIDFETQTECFKKYGIKHTFIGAWEADFDNIAERFSENGIICDSVHATFKKINDMWSADEKAAQKMLDSLKDSVDKCKRHGIPVVVVHLSSGKPMPEINEAGVKRFKELFDYAEESGVTVALENLRFLENLSYFLENFENVGFCWDNGHEYSFTKGIRFMELFGKRAKMLHIHDNRCGIDTDDHLIPFDGNIDFETVAKNLADSGYSGTLMLELNRNAVLDGKKVYEGMSDEEYILRAVNALEKLSSLTDKYRR